MHASEPRPYSTLVELLRWRATHQPDRRAYTFLVDGDTEETHLTYAELDRRARAIAARLQASHGSGERVMLLHPPGTEFIAGFFGCLYAGAVAVPAYPPQPGRLERTLPRLLAIATDARPRVGLVTSKMTRLVEMICAEAPALQTLQWLTSDAVGADLAEQWRDPEVSRPSLALLQYTSGSTAVPRGVMVSHGNIMENSALIQRSLESTPESRWMIWVPPYHDMGLIGGLLQPLYAGCPVTLMSPVEFLLRPYRWLRAISRTRATVSGGPNFAYDLCTRKITPAQLETLDLSSWEVAFNGSEPIRAETLEQFAARFEPCGFRREAFYPCYGLAEATVFVSGGDKADPPAIHAVQSWPLERHRLVTAAPGDADTRRLVGCGRIPPGQTLLIVDPDSLTECPSDRIGEIWTSGASTTLGYWNRPDETDRVYRGYLAGTGAGPFLRTGDLGFVRDGQLFVTGRLKDLLVISGRNHYPQDIERTVERSHAALRPGSCAAFSVDVDGEERLVVMAEVERRSWRRGGPPEGWPDSPGSHRPLLDADELVRTVRREIAEHHGLRAYRVLLLDAGTLPKTTNGKLQRHACRSRYLAGGIGAGTR